MFWPSDAQRYAGLVHCEYAKLVYTFAQLGPSGRIPPSLEVLAEEARRDPRLDLLAVICRHRIELR